MRSLLGVDIMESDQIFPYLRGLIHPFSVQEREMERRRMIEMRFKAPKMLAMIGDGQT
jgi:hypothetical protein